MKNFLKNWQMKLKSFLCNLADNQKRVPTYLLTLFDEKNLINKVYLFHTPKQAQEFLKQNDQYLEWIAYLIDLKNNLENRPYIKLS